MKTHGLRAHVDVTYSELSRKEVVRNRNDRIDEMLKAVIGLCVG
jgi:hypothetical protein